ncbi:arrestin domain-containing protein 3-like isoform X2 [Hemibagrus wyckioides]|uniref:arrestin domain-containing protein 3-like isoform X2 n=1 Tax=Hemibagrus wyckioides TaxID=337641 RepID=UPI00266CA280|nr:arrestin domain-containing protein 3-like isoform X2 [Hemibagrus wyckioides]
MTCKVNSISVAFDSVRESSTFTNGDYISGRVTLEVAKEIHIQSLYVKAKGEASVLWSENHGRYNVVVYHDKVLCFKSTLHFIQEQTKGQDGYSLLTNECGQCYSRIVEPGTHVYPFTFQIPHQDMPASFKGYHGKVVYFLEAKLCRSMTLPKKDKVHFNYVPRGDMSVPDLMMSQHGYKEKKMKLLTSGSVTMDVHIEKMGFHLGEQMTVKIDVVNNSSRTVKPKLVLYQKQSFFASKKKTVRTKELLKEKGDPIKPSTKETVTKVLNIPTDISVSILNCRVLKVEYRLKVNLDIKFAYNPEIKLPVVVLPVCVTQEDKDLMNIDMGNGFESWTSKQADLIN